MIELLIVIIVVGMLVWLAVTYLPLPAPFKTILMVVAVVCVVVYILRAFGIFHGVDLPVPQLR